MFHPLAKPALILAFALFSLITTAPLMTAPSGIALADWHVITPSLLAALLTVLFLARGSDLRHIIARGLMAVGVMVFLLPLAIWLLGPRPAQAAVATSAGFGASGFADADLFLTARAIGSALGAPIAGGWATFTGLAIGAMMLAWGLTRSFDVTPAPEQWSVELSGLIEQHDGNAAADRKGKMRGL